MSPQATCVPPHLRFEAVKTTHVCVCVWVIFAQAKIANQADSSNIQDHILQSGEVETSIIFGYAVFNRPTYQFQYGIEHGLVVKDLLRQHQVCLMPSLTTF